MPSSKSIANHIKTMHNESDEAKQGNNNNTTQFYNIDNANAYESFEHKKPAIYETLGNIHISLDQVASQKIPKGQTTHDDVDVLKSRIDNIELMLEDQNKLISDIEASIKHCIYQVYCDL